MNILQSLLLVALPYAAIVAFVVGLAWRYRSRMTISSLSSQILESRWLPWGTVPFHAGIAVLFLGHLAPLVAPGFWGALVSNRRAVLIVETIGLAAAILCLSGLAVLFVRRLFSAPVRAGSTIVDLIVLAALLAQAGTGVAVATLHRWGSVWSTTTTTPYLRGVLTFQPDPAFAAGIPLLATIHLTGAWVLLALIPYTRLVHLFSFPAGYLRRPPQKVIWTRVRPPRAGAPS